MQSDIVSIKVDESETVSGIISVPKNNGIEKATGIIIAHGAGNDMRNTLLTAYAEELNASGCFCLRSNFPYKDKGKFIDHCK